MENMEAKAIEIAERVALLSTHVGEQVTILPRRSVGESRDTEPGLQPWDATLVGLGEHGPIVQQGDHEPRELHGYAKVSVRNDQLTIGEW